jgi:hypothetical protein
LVNYPESGHQYLRFQASKEAPFGGLCTVIPFLYVFGVRLPLSFIME